MKVFLLGCGNIGRFLAKAAQDMDEVEEIIINDNHPEFIIDFISSLTKACLVDSFELIDEVDLVVEAASQEAARMILPMALSKGKDIMVLSVGALVDDDFREECRRLSKENGGRIMIPSGALCGGDGLRSAAVAGLNEVELISTKGPKSLKGVKYLEDKGIDVEAIETKTVLFRGSAREAVRLFPKNVNVSATVSLLGVGFDRTMVTVILDPEAKDNSHELIAHGDFGTIHTKTSNRPFPENPATSYLAALSAVSALRRIISNEWIGI